MNRKGFTLIELLAVIVLIGIVSVMVVPNVLDIQKESKDASYKILIKNIKTASVNYYLECENGDLSSTKYGSYACSISSNSNGEYYIETTLSALANTGFLTVSDTNSSGNKIVLDPRDTSKDLSSCTIVITKKTEKVTDSNGEEVKDSNGIPITKTTYSVESTSSDSNCPSTYEE